MAKTTNEVKKAPVDFGKSAIVFVITFALILSGIMLFGTSAHMPLVLAAAVAGIVGILSGYKWTEMEAGICDTIKASAPAMLIMLIIGMVIGTWMLGGIVPTMIYYGLTWISPKIFLLTACLLCTLVSTFTGSSWSTMGTVGVALMGVGAGLGVNAGMTCGAIISGAYFGDKISPLSDTTNLAPAMAGTTVFSHMKHMVYTTTPSYIVALIIYGILGISVVGENADLGTIDLYLETLDACFNISPIMLIPPICVLLMVIFKVPAIPGLLGVAALGGIFAIAFQGATLSQVLGAAYTGVSMDTGVEAINKLVNRGGLSGMMDTIALILIALAFAGIVERTGMVHSVVEKILSHAKSDKAMMTTTVFSTLFTNFATGVQYVAIVLPGRMFRQTFRDRNLHPKNLSRILEDVGTLCAPFCPYGTDGAFILGTLGVATGQYAPFMFFAMLNPIMSLICIWTGWTIKYMDPAQKDEDIIP
ncbi:Na+/H+ antiporter NhaC [Lawsonibacter sp. LCP25S3_G6]|uniref:Na+/H+ antiporter NhaC n=1 Tax=unclassified Lawsonibacter TaxID=2617946 RepID=UPI003F9A34C6